MNFIIVFTLIRLTNCYEKFEKPLKSKINYLTHKITHFKPFFNLWYGKNNKNAYFVGCCPMTTPKLETFGNIYFLCVFVFLVL